MHKISNNPFSKGQKMSKDEFCYIFTQQAQTAHILRYLHMIALTHVHRLDIQMQAVSAGIATDKKKKRRKYAFF